MSIEAVEYKGGAGRAKIVCDNCDRDEVVPCAYVGPGNASQSNGRPNESQARAKALRMGWSYIKGKLRCPKCEAKRKATNMQTAQSKVTPIKAPSEPTKKQRIEIIGLIATAYDLDAERYVGGETDDTVASAAGVVPGWVAQIREAEFGPDGSNDDIETLRAEIAADREAIAAAIKASTEQTEKLISKLAAVKDYAERLDRIKAAVGPRNVKRAGV